MLSLSHSAVQIDGGFSFIEIDQAKETTIETMTAQVRHVMISRMAKPEEVLVVENEQGEVVREFMKDTDSINLYKNMRETLGKFLCVCVCLCH